MENCEEKQRKAEERENKMLEISVNLSEMLEVTFEKCFKLVKKFPDKKAEELVDIYFQKFRVYE